MKTSRPGVARRSLWAAATLAGPAMLGACAKIEQVPSPCALAIDLSTDLSMSEHAGMIWIDGGEFVMGSPVLHPSEGPPRNVHVSGFWIDITEITNRQFAAFVRTTGYVTLAERPLDPELYPGVPDDLLRPSSLVFVGADQGTDLSDPSQWWRVVPEANWRQPQGPGSSIDGKDAFPVVHIAYEDALAYARWRGRDLPTESEWEYAARGGLKEARYVWGKEVGTPSRTANYWQGFFPINDTGEDGYRASTARVGCFPANGYGLHDMAGNVWEWVRTEHGSREPQATGEFQPPGAQRSRHIVKGGSFLCAENYCFSYRPAARESGPVAGGASHIGFRTVLRGHP